MCVDVSTPLLMGSVPSCRVGGYDAGVGGVFFGEGVAVVGSGCFFGGCQVSEMCCVGDGMIIGMIDGGLGLCHIREAGSERGVVIVFKVKLSAGCSHCSLSFAIL